VAVLAAQGMVTMCHFVDNHQKSTSTLDMPTSGKDFEMKGCERAPYAICGVV
jgi:hypothetical protein